MSTIAAIGPERKPYRIDGHPATHGQFIRRHVEAIGASTSGYEPEIHCTGPMVFHGELALDEKTGKMIPHWAGDALHAEIVCVICMDAWMVETEYRKSMRDAAEAKADAAEYSKHGPSTPW